MTAPEVAPLPEDPGGAAAAINRYRDLAKWVIGVFAAVGGLLVAGSQLSSLGQLELEGWDLVRLLAAVGGLLLALGAAMCVVRTALTVLSPVEMSVEALATDSAVADKLNEHPLSIPEVERVQELPAVMRLVLADPLRDDATKRAWAAAVQPLLDHAAYLKTRAAFDAAWPAMAKAALVAAFGIIVFAYAANPPEEEDEPDEPAPAVIAPKPRVAHLDLTRGGAQALSRALGARCAQGSPRALVIGGTRARPQVVVLPEGGCRPAQLVLTQALGVALP